MCLISHLDANADGDENKPETVTPHEDWEIMSPPLDRQTSDVSLLEKKKKSRIRVGMGEFNAVWRVCAGRIEMCEMYTECIQC